MGSANRFFTFIATVPRGINVARRELRTSALSRSTRQAQIFAHLLLDFLPGKGGKRSNCFILNAS
jgi:hypothetical protein